MLACLGKIFQQFIFILKKKKKAYFYVDVVSFLVFNGENHSSMKFEISEVTEKSVF